MWSEDPEDREDTRVQEAAWASVELDDGVNMDFYILAQLQEWMDYQIRMISFNDVGSSPVSHHGMVKTRESS